MFPNFFFLFFYEYQKMIRCFVDFENTKNWGKDALYNVYTGSCVLNLKSIQVFMLLNKKKSLKLPLGKWSKKFFFNHYIYTFAFFCLKHKRFISHESL